MTTIITKCHCNGTLAADYQDRRYGKNNRVANYNAKGEACCTSCGTVHRDVPKISVPKKKTGTGGGRYYVAIPPAEGWPGGLPEKNGWRPGGK